MKNIEISNCASTIETKLIHFHSCMDFFRKKYNKKCSNFSKDLIDLLDTNEIAIDDLVPKQQIDDIRNKKSRNSAFKFTQLRNGYLHDGFEVFEGDYKAVVKEVDIMRCICERFILKRMGINHEDTILGSF
jgi:hypothetical protein